MLNTNIFFILIFNLTAKSFWETNLLFSFIFEKPDIACKKGNQFAEGD